MLLKEITLRYSPKGGTPRQLVQDFYAMFGLWRTEGSGGQAGTSTHGRTGVIDDVFSQVAHQLGKTYLNRPEITGVEEYKKDFVKLNHALKMEDWMEFYAAFDTINKARIPEYRYLDLKKLEGNPKEKLEDLSPVVQRLVQTSKQFPDVKKPEPQYKQLDKPLTAPPAAGQRELPMAGSQMDLPLKPREKLPVPNLTGVKPLEPTMAGNEPKEAGGMTAKFLGDYGYAWSEEDKAYKNDKRGVSIQIFPNNSATVTLANGHKKDFKDLGLLFRRMAHNKNKRHPATAPVGEPVASVTEGNYKMLYEFLYR